MKAKELQNLGLGRDHLPAAFACIEQAAKAGLETEDVRDEIRRIVEHPEQYVDDAVWGELAEALEADPPEPPDPPPGKRERLAPFQVFGEDVDEPSLQQLRDACKLPISVRGALMPDAHLGYGLPIGGVLATEGAVIPYAVGVDIACRMKMSVLDLPTGAIEEQSGKLESAIEAETSFGVGAGFRSRRQHGVMDEDWSFSPIVRKLKDKAWEQLGTSGSGNHFVEYGVLTVETDTLGLEPGAYLALLSHSGSRGAGNEVATYYSTRAMERRGNLPKELKRLAWLELDSDLGREYWRAMELMGRYASANHELIHRHVAGHLGVEVLLDIENHHNFAWMERHDGKDVVVHRKGATPAGPGAIGIIPGSMATPGFVVRGKGNEKSLCSASHGAGRTMSRKAAKRSLNWADARRLLAERGVRLISAGLDEVPMVYKDIHEVMAAQKDLVDVLGRFDPKLVKMAPGGRAED